jgi:hypothetical protein
MAYSQQLSPARRRWRPNSILIYAHQFCGGTQVYRNIWLNVFKLTRTKTLLGRTRYAGDKGRTSPQTEDRMEKD